MSLFLEIRGNLMMNTITYQGFYTPSLSLIVGELRNAKMAAINTFYHTEHNTLQLARDRHGSRAVPSTF